MDKLSSVGRKLSVAMIARDAEATIGAALESVRSVADEIVVVDTGSAGRTREIARQRASKVVEYPWSDDFSAARNFALTQITGDWVLWLDASEQLDPQTAREIRRHFDGQPDPNSAYLLLVQMPAGAGQIDGEQVGRLRLWPTRAGLKFTGRVHEQIIPNLEAVGLSENTTTWCIRRSHRDVDPQIKAAKARRDIHLAELESAQSEPRTALMLAQGEAWTALGEPLKAAGWFRKAIDETVRGSTEQLEAYYGLLTTFDSRPLTHEQQLATCVEALDIFPLDAQLLCAMGSYMQSQGRLDLACRCYQTAVEHGQVDMRTWHLANLADVATVCYSLTLELQNLTNEARAALENGLAARSQSLRLRRQLIDLHIKHNRRQEALSEAEHLSAATGTQLETLRNAVRGACLAAQQQWPEALAYLRTAHEAGCRDPICLRWLASCYIGSGEVEAATPILQQWQNISPESPEPNRILESLGFSSTVENSVNQIALPGTDGNALRADSPMPSPAAAVKPPRFIEIPSHSTPDRMAR